MRSDGSGDGTRLATGQTPEERRQAHQLAEQIRAFLGMYLDNKAKEDNRSLGLGRPEPIRHDDVDVEVEATLENAVRQIIDAFLAEAALSDPAAQSERTQLEPARPSEPRWSDREPHLIQARRDK